MEYSLLLMGRQTKIPLRILGTKPNSQVVFDVSGNRGKLRLSMFKFLPCLEKIEAATLIGSLCPQNSQDIWSMHQPSDMSFKKVFYIQTRWFQRLF